MEHKFEVPKIDDIEVYYDLTSAFVAVLQRTIMFSLNSNLEIYINDTEDNKIGFFGIEYDFKKPSVKTKWNIGEAVNETLVCDTGEPTEFAFF